MNRQNSTPSRDLAMIAIFAGMIAALGLIPAFSGFGSSVPITAQSLGIMLAGAILGPKRGGLAVVVFLALVALGLPLLAGGRGGLGVFSGPSVGYLIGFPIAAFLIGALVYAVGAPYRLTWGIAINLIIGVALLNLIGIVGMMERLDISFSAATKVAWAFVPGDTAKAVLCAIVARGVHAAYPGLLPNRRSKQPLAESTSV
ncbi:biotin transporter BioY [Nocardioides sp. Bht2]|uniref:biotin transporter BioY n=1 Tax=Nocardioides sp. Bht2 TaxID=3392297 RepID=UPI0039B550E9